MKCQYASLSVSLRKYPRPTKNKNKLLYKSFLLCANYELCAEYKLLVATGNAYLILNESLFERKIYFLKKIHS